MTEQTKAALQEFQARLNSEPDPTGIDKTPDGKAKTLLISYVEMTLDELYIGQWGTEHFTTKVIANEVVGELELWAINPITGTTVKRSGAAAIIIQVDKVPDSIKDNSQYRNRWALNPDNKKSNALDLGYPKLKAECVKNAAQSLGKIFGRDLNRKKSDVYKPAFKPLSDKGFSDLIKGLNDGSRNELDIARAKSHFNLTDLQLTILDGEKPKLIANG